MRRSRYVDEYLDAAAEHGRTPATFLALSPVRSARIRRSYARALRRAINEATSHSGCVEYELGATREAKRLSRQHRRLMNSLHRGMASQDRIDEYSPEEPNG